MLKSLLVLNILVKVVFMPDCGTVDCFACFFYHVCRVSGSVHSGSWRAGREPGLGDRENVTYLEPVRPSVGAGPARCRRWSCPVLTLAAQCLHWACPVLALAAQCCHWACPVLSRGLGV